MSRWWRAYDEAVDDPKLQQLPPSLSWAWFNLCCITSQNGGNLPAIEAIAFKLRSTPAKTKRVIAALVEAGLIDIDANGQRPHNWNARQFKSDVTDPTAASRMKRHRNRKRNDTVTDTVTVTHPETDTESETERKKETATAVPAPYVFESGVIRLNQVDFDKWLEAFTYLDLKAELLSLTEWAATQPKWYFAVSGALAKRNREAKLAREKTQADPSKGYWGNRIPGIV